jgi:hypothetical protein
VTPLKEALTVLADVLAKRPAEEILFDWFRSGRLVGELSVLIKRRHPEVQAEIDRVYQEHLANATKLLRSSEMTRCGGATDRGEPERSAPFGSAQGFRSVIRIIATALLSLTTCSFVPVLQVQT